ncbi:MAG: hypothetical protein MZV70_28355 [Desulfobacterales bacterium]|nr:hypothetical protein [Desulfobacterales bacterium]
MYGALPSRGRIIPAIDLSKIYPIEKPTYNNAKLLIIDAENEHIGFLSEITLSSSPMTRISWWRT